MMGVVEGVPVAFGVSDVQGVIDTSQVSTTDVVVAAAVAVGTVLVAWLVGRVTRRYLSRPGTSSLQLAALGARASRWLVVFVGFSWAASFVGADASWFTITVALVAVLAVLVTRPLLENFAAGVALTSRPAFGIGDDVGIKEFEGTVLEITGRSTVLRLRDGRRVHIPNTDVVDETIVVYTTDQKRRTSVEFEIEGSHTVAEVERVILNGLANTRAVASDPPPRVRARGFGDAVILSVRFWHDSALGDEAEALDQAMRSMSAALREAGMTLAPRSLAVDLRSRDRPGSPSAA